MMNRYSLVSLKEKCHRMVALTVMMASAGSALAQSAAVEPDFEFFRDEVQPIFLAKREGNIPCIACHERNPTFRLQPLEQGAFFWNEEQSRQNYEAARAWVQAGQPPLRSRLLTHPLAADAGGDPFHGGGKHFANQSDPEWRILAEWVSGATTRSAPRDTVVRIIQTNAAGDDAHLIDPWTNQVVGVIDDIEIPHGVTGSPDGSVVYISNEHLRTLDVVDSRTMRVKRRIPLSGRPNNVATSKDGTKVYVGIMQAPGAVDVIDVVNMVNLKSVPTRGAIHNVYVTPDGRYAVAGSIQGRSINVIDTATDETAWTKDMDAGIRPMIFSTKPDGSTQTLFAQLSDFHGLVAIDFDTQQEIARIEHPPVEGEHAHLDGLQAAPAHGLGIPPDGRTLWSTSKVYSHAYILSLPGLEEIARVNVGQHPEWVTFTPDGRFAYIGAAGDNATYVVDTNTYTVIAKIPVGQTPKRVGTVLMQID